MKFYNDSDFIDLIDEYLNNENFKKTKYIEQHGVNRYDHSLRVAYYSYLITKFLKLDYSETAIGGLLHDFFLDSSDKTFSSKFKYLFIHPKLAFETASLEFDLSEKELDIIKTHMFPVSFFIPKYLESWIVSFVDKCVASYEFSIKFKLKAKYAYDLFLIFIISNL